MQELEKILEEICGKAIELKNIIRNHMKDGWIPVDERLPVEGEEVIVTTNAELITLGYIYDGEWEIDEKPDYPIAWQPLPDPYRPERSNDHDGNETLKIAIHCLGVLAEHEVCEECPVYNESGIACREVAREAITALKEIQKYRSIGELSGESDIKLK